MFSHRAGDPVFAEGWDRALEQGYARLEAKLLEMQFRQAAGPGLEFDGAFEPPDSRLVDPEMTLQLLKQHKAEVTRICSDRAARDNPRARAGQAAAELRARAAGERCRNAPRAGQEPQGVRRAGDEGRFES